MRLAAAASPPSCSSPFCLIWLASAAAGADQLAGTASRPGERIWPDQQAQLLGAAGPLADLLDLLGRQPRAVHHAAAGLELGELLVLRQPRDFLGQRDDVLAAPTRPPASRSGLRRPAPAAVPSVARRARLFLTTSSWMFLPRSSLRSVERSLRVQADHVHQQQRRSRRPAAASDASVIRFLTNLLMADCLVSSRRAIAADLQCSL